jgi:hypothetical protein
MRLPVECKHKLTENILCVCKSKYLLLTKNTQIWIGGFVLFPDLGNKLLYYFLFWRFKRFYI